MLKQEYINPIDIIIEKLIQEKNRRIKALESNHFSDNDILKENIRILENGINAMSLNKTSNLKTNL